jgi:hypothetical protein
MEISARGACSRATHFNMGSRECQALFLVIKYNIIPIIAVPINEGQQ